MSLKRKIGLGCCYLFAAAAVWGFHVIDKINYPDYHPEYVDLMKSLNESRTTMRESRPELRPQKIIITSKECYSKNLLERKDCQNFQSILHQYGLIEIDYHYEANREGLVLKYPEQFLKSYNMSYEYASDDQPTGERVIFLTSAISSFNKSSHHYDERFNFCERYSIPHWFVCAYQPK